MESTLSTPTLGGETRTAGEWAQIPIGTSSLRLRGDSTHRDFFLRSRIRRVARNGTGGGTIDGRRARSIRRVHGPSVAIFGGTFDPPHVGHLAAASEVRHAGRHDEVLVTVAGDPWQKSSQRSVTPAAIRLEMVGAALEGHPGLVASDLEVRRAGPSYTVDTVEALLAERPGARVALVVGADAAARIDTWHRADDLRSMVELTVMTRPGHDAAPPAGWRVSRVAVPSIDVSSTDIRCRCRDGRPIDFLVPDRVAAIVRRHGLYREAR